MSKLNKWRTLLGRSVVAASAGRARNGTGFSPGRPGAAMGDVTDQFSCGRGPEASAGAAVRQAKKMPRTNRGKPAREETTMAGRGGLRSEERRVGKECRKRGAGWQ